MRLSLTASLYITLGLLCRVSTSFSASPDDPEGSGYDLEGSGSGSGEWSGENEDSEDVGTFAANPDVGPQDTLDGLSVMTSDKSQWSTKDNYIILANSKSFLETKEVHDGVIAGGVTGAILAAAVAAILIYRWQKKDDEGFILGQRMASDEDYYKQSRDDIV
uniref:syndecan-2-B-like n=1 Tax=Semicossyphus pulcher TaxID=241346 RepID=UPI0037E74803